MSSNAAPTSAAASKAQRTAAAAAYHAARQKANGSISVAASKSVDPVEAALKKITSTSESYDDFVRSFGETQIQRLDANGENALTSKSHTKRMDDSAEANSDLSESTAAGSSAIVAAAPPLASSSSSSSSPSSISDPVTSSSDFLTLMRMLAEDKAKYAGSTRIITGDEQDEHDPRSHPSGGRRSGNGFDPALAAAFQGSHIRVDDSYGFAPDPFAPESRPGASDDNDEEEDETVVEDPAERHARIRVLGDDEEVSDSDTENSVSIASRKLKSRAETTEESEEAEEDVESDSSATGVDANLFLTEEEAGASLESEPVPDDYLYDSQKDAMSYQEFQQQKQQKLQQQREKQQTASTSSSALSALTTKQEKADKPAETESPDDSTKDERPDPTTANARAASRLAADEAVAARQQAAVAGTEGPVSDEVESFLYNPHFQSEKAVVAEFSDSDEERDAEDMRRRNLAAITREKRTQEAVTGVTAGSSTSNVPSSSSSSSSNSASSSSNVTTSTATAKTANKPAAHESDFIVPPPRSFSNSNTTTRPIPGGTTSSSNSARTVSKPLAELEGDDDDVVPTMDDDIETVDLEGESSTSVPIFAQIDSASGDAAASASSSATALTTAGAGMKAPSKVHIGNFLSAKDRLGFDEDLPSTPEADAISTDEEAEWIEGEEEMQATINSTSSTTANAASAIMASAAANASSGSSYVPSTGPRQKRSLLK